MAALLVGTWSGGSPSEDGADRVFLDGADELYSLAELLVVLPPPFVRVLDGVLERSGQYDFSGCARVLTC